MTREQFEQWNEISMEWYRIAYIELPDDGAQQEAVVLEAERRNEAIQKASAQ